MKTFSWTCRHRATALLPPKRLHRQKRRRIESRSLASKAVRFKLIVSSNVSDQFQDNLTATAGGVESSLPFVLADNGGQPLRPPSERRFSRPTM